MGLLGQEHVLGDLAVGQAVTDEVEQRAFLRGQRGQRTWLVQVGPKPVHQRGSGPIVQQMSWPAQRVAGGRTTRSGQGAW